MGTVAAAVYIRTMRGKSRGGQPLGKLLAKTIERWLELFPNHLMRNNIPDVLEGLAIDYRDRAKREQEIAA